MLHYIHIILLYLAPVTNGVDHSVELGMKLTDVEVKHQTYTKGIDVQQVNITCKLSTSTSFSICEHIIAYIIVTF